MSSAAVVIGTLRVKTSLLKKLNTEKEVIILHEPFLLKSQDYLKDLPFALFPDLFEIVDRLS